jgi:anti-sigma regulatory factor (Ser/Thr protein kinase)
MGKGIPAALLGAAAKSQFPQAMWHLMATGPAGEIPEPRDLVTAAHAYMARELIELDSFVTLCYARLDRRANRFELVDCGHTGVVHFEARTGRCSIMHGTNVPLGVIDGEIFDQVSVAFATGDIFLFYSDGVTEARDEHGELFGTERLLDCVRRNAAFDPMVLVEAVRAAATAFSRSAAPADDLTCVAVAVVDYEVPLAHAELELASDLAELHRARAFIRDACGDFLGADEIAAVELAVDEAVSNIVKHAYGGRTDQRIRLGVAAYRDHVAIQLRHMGKPFDRSRVAAPALDGSRESGFGVYLIEQSVDAVRYGRDELGRNYIELDKNRRAAP